MRVLLQLLIPGVDDAEEADLGSEAPGGLFLSPQLVQRVASWSDLPCY
jgi:hypothetical protein